MLYYLFDFIEKNYNMPGAGLFQFISFRAGLGILLSLGFVLFLGQPIINWLRSQQIGESVRELGLQGQKIKEGTPTMGGLIILSGIIIPVLLVAKLDNIYIILLLVATIWMGVIGYIDDYIKVFKKDKDGLKGKFKIIGQVLLGLFVALTFMFHKDIYVRVPTELAKSKNYNIIDELTIDVEVYGDRVVSKDVSYIDNLITNVPFLKDNKLNYEWFVGGSQKWVFLIYIPIIIFIITSVSNGANLTDGLDGLLTGVSAIIGATLGVIAYISGNAITSDYLDILFIPNLGETVIFTSCFLGSCIGFLWYNSFPAKVFMGDTGSLAIGSIIAVLAIILRKELLIPLLCGVFFAETLSVVIQVSYFKYTRKKYGEGRRIFLMSPLHHHYQKKGLHEVTIVTRFWIITILLAILAIITLKIR